MKPLGTFITFAAGALLLIELWQIRSLKDQLNSAQAEIHRLQTASKIPANPVTTNNNSALNKELASLRNEVTQRRKAERELGPEETALKLWADQILSLKKASARMPDKSIPEIQFATSKDWADAAWGMDLNTDDGIREALSKLRDRAVNAFFNEALRPALKRYLTEHDNVLPSDLSQLKPYLSQQSADLSDDVFQRYHLLQSGKLSSDPSKPILELATHVDPDYDSEHQMGINGASGGRYNRVQGEVEMAAAAFANANNGALPTAPGQIAPFITNHIEPAAIQKYLSSLAREASR